MRDNDKRLNESAAATMAALEEQVAAIRKEELQKRELIIENFGKQTQAVRSEIEETIGIELKRVRSELAKATADLAFYKEEYLKAISSRSWQITRPLRLATDIKQRLAELLRHGHRA